MCVRVENAHIPSRHTHIALRTVIIMYVFPFHYTLLCDIDRLYSTYILLLFSNDRRLIGNYYGNNTVPIPIFSIVNQELLTETYLLFYCYKTNRFHFENAKGEKGNNVFQLSKLKLIGN